jgi:hypothetical protein
MSIPIIDPKGFYQEAYRVYFPDEEPKDVFTRRLNERMMEDDYLQIITQTGTDKCWIAEVDDLNPDQACDALTTFSKFLDKEATLESRDSDGDAFQISYHEDRDEYLYEYLNRFDIAMRDLKALSNALNGLMDSIGDDDLALSRLHTDKLATVLKKIGIVHP